MSFRFSDRRASPMSGARVRLLRGGRSVLMRQTSAGRVSPGVDGLLAILARDPRVTTATTPTGASRRRRAPRASRRAPSGCGGLLFRDPRVVARAWARHLFGRGRRSHRRRRRGEEAIRRAIALGCNHIDTAINWSRAQRARDRKTPETVLHAKECKRDEVFACTKGGYIPDERHGARGDAIGALRKEDVVAGASDLRVGPRGDAEAELANLRLDTVDLYYLHILKETRRAAVRARQAPACGVRDARAAGRRGYGPVSWHGDVARYRVPPSQGTT
ncbi:MAG: aldo/keto reductase [Acidobacteriota bacterium]